MFNWLFMLGIAVLLFIALIIWLVTRTVTSVVDTAGDTFGKVIPSVATSTSSIVPHVTDMASNVLTSPEGIGNLASIAALV